MTAIKTLKVEAIGERQIAMTRAFNAPARLVFDAYTKPDLVRRWLTGPPGWLMTVCDMDVRVGGAYRWVWRKNGDEMGMGGVYREIKKPVRLVNTEKFDESWYDGEAVGEIDLVEKDGKTTVTQTLTYESRVARDQVLKSGMESGVEFSYNNLERLLETELRG
jgi:uncharacterized protein YndB with AHSA1/START domain